MKRFIRIIGAVLLLAGIILLGFALYSYAQIQQVASLPANSPGATPATLPLANDSLPTPVVFPTIDPNQPTSTPIIFPTAAPSETLAQLTPTPPASSPASNSANPPPAQVTAGVAPAQARGAPPVKMFVRGDKVKKDIPVKEAGWSVSEQSGQWVADWDIPFDAAGHHNTTPDPGQVGNVIISGHHNLIGPNQFGVGLFAYFWNLAAGDRIYFLNADGKAYEYTISESYPVLEQGQPLSVREQHAAQIMAPSADPILTLITCWAGPQNPFASNTYRWIVTGKLMGPVDVNSIPPVQ